MTEASRIKYLRTVLLLDTLRTTEEWKCVEREVDIRCVREEP
jgi:hypothetical protein